MAYRHILRYLDSVCPAYDDALAAYYKGVSPETPPVYYADRSDPISLLVHDWGGRLRIEGDAGRVSLDALLEWCVRMNPRGAATTSEDLSDFLSKVLGPDSWSVNFHYTVTARAFLGHRTREVYRLTPLDRDAFEVFLDRPADTPFLNIRRANNNLARDLAWMCVGLPITCYAVRVGDDIAGVCTVYQITPLYDEMSRLYVAREFRGHGIGKSLLTVATEDTLALGRQPAFAVGGDPDKLDHLLTTLGYKMAHRFWHKRYWWDVPSLSGNRSGNSTSSS